MTLPARPRLSSTRAFFFGPLFVAVAATTVSGQLYVDQNAAGPIHDGTTWCTGFLRLEEALAVATPGEIIRIADGIYTPDPAGLADPRSATFDIAPDLTVMGGFSGCGGEDPHLWDPFNQIVTLSGDVAGDDPAGTTDNAYHVLTATGSGAQIGLIGLEVIAGRADGTDDDALGGGLFAFGSQVGMRLVHFRDNEAWRGAAVYAEGGSLDFIQCSVIGNHASGEGGAVFHTSSLDAKDCLFASNSAVSDGGAIFSDLASLRLLGCTVAGNVSGNRGGGIYEYVGVEGRVQNSIVWGNEDLSGSGEEAQLFINPSNIMFVDYSCVQGWSGTFEGEGNFGDDPLFTDAAAGDFHFEEGSPCLDAGDTDLVETQRDLDDNPRVLVEVDMGCYEHPFTSTAPEVGETLGRGLIESIRPAGPELEVRLRLPPDAKACALRVHDPAGRALARLSVEVHVDAGTIVRWDGRDSSGKRAPSGVYLFSLVVDGVAVESKKALWVR